MEEIRLLLVGLGQLGRRFCRILHEKSTDLQHRYGLKFTLVGAADSLGAAYCPQGLDLMDIVALKTVGGSIAHYPEYGQWRWNAVDLVAQASADVLLEASPVHIEQGAEPGLTCIRTAMRKGMHVVTPNKGPLVVAFDELHELARAHRVQLRYDGTVAGGLPALNVGIRDLKGAKVLSIVAVPNLVTGYVMDLQTEGLSFDDATERARDEGVLEGDGVWDLDGWDAAAKLVILANAVMGQSARLEDVIRSGVREITPQKLAQAHEGGYLYRLIAQASWQDDGSVHLEVKPTPLASNHPMGRLGRKQMGVVYETDIYGTISLIIDEETPVPSAATMLRDLLDIYT